MTFTNSEPMKSIVTTDYLVNVKSTIRPKGRLGVLNKIDSQHLREVILKVNDKGFNEQNRQQFLDNDKFFRQEIKEKPNIGSHELGVKVGITDEKAKEIFKKIKDESILKKEEDKEVPKKQREFFKKIRKKLNSLLDSSDKKAISLFFFDLIIQGTFLNYIVFIIFNQRFTYYTWIAWGLLAWFMERRFPLIIRSLWIK